MTTTEILLVAVGLALAVPAVVAAFLIGYSKLLDRAADKKSFRVLMSLVVGILFLGMAVIESAFGEGPPRRIGVNAALGVTWIGMAVWNKWFEKQA